MFDLLRGLVRAAIITAVILMPVLFFPVLAGAAAVYAYNAVRSRRALEASQSQDESQGERRTSRREQRREARREQARVREIQRAQAVEYDPKRGWNVDALPFDMNASFMGGRKSVAYFDCAGIDSLVKGVPNGKDVDYRFKVKDPQKAKMLQEKARMYNGAARVERVGDEFYVHASNAKAINDLAKEAFPPSRHDVTREITQLRQYYIEGAKDYEDAKRIFEATRDRRVPDRTVHTQVDTVDGVQAMRQSNGQPLDPASLALGMYVISETEVSTFKGKVSIPGNVEGDASVAAAAIEAFEPSNENRVASPDGGKVKISDGTPEKVGRYVLDDYGRGVDVVRLDDPRYRDLHAYVVCQDVDELAAVVNGGELPKGSLVVVDRMAPDLRDGQFYIELERSDDVRSRLGIQGEASPAFAAKCESLGVGAEQLEACLVMDEVSRNGYANARLKDSVSLERAKVNGLPVNELAERLTNDRLPKLDREAAGVWIKDASKIQAISVTVDPKRAEMRITSVVDNCQKVETRKMSDKEVTEFSRRPGVTKSEMKDLLMQVHPDFFKSYSVGGRSLYEDPVRDFIAGRKPAAVPELKAQMQEAKKQRQQKPVRKPSGPKRGV